MRMYAACGLEAVSPRWCSGRGKIEALDEVTFLHGQTAGQLQEGDE